MWAVAQDATDLALVARSPVHVMVTARNGADRAAWARAIHDRSARCDGPFVAVCGHTLPAADRTVRIADIDDWFARAAAGTLFIDRVGDLDRQAQDRLAQRLSEQSHRAGRTMPDGHNRVRVIAGSNRSLRTDLAAGAFSDVLFYRLNVIHINLMDRHEPRGPFLES